MIFCMAKMLDNFQRGQDAGGWMTCSRLRYWMLISSASDQHPMIFPISDNYIFFYAQISKR